MIKKYIFAPCKPNQKNMSDIASRVKKIIVDKLGVEEAEVTNEASFTNDLGADSLDTVELIMEFEKEFNISILTSKLRPLQLLVRPSLISRSTPSNLAKAFRFPDQEINCTAFPRYRMVVRKAVFLKNSINFPLCN